MANMQTLVWASSFNALKTSYPTWNQSTSQVYKSIVYTGDGYIITHGTAIKGAIEGATEGSVTGYVNGNTLYIKDATGKEYPIELPLVAVEGTSNNITVSNPASGKVTVDLADKTPTSSTGQVSNGQIELSKVTADNKGRIESITNTTITVDQVKISNSSTGKLLTATAEGTNHVGLSSIDVNGSVISVSDVTLGNDSLKEKLSIINSEISANKTNIEDNAAELSNLTTTVANNKAEAASALSTHEAKKATAADHGHVKLTDSVNVESGATGASKIDDYTAVTPYALQQAAKSVLSQAEAYAKTIASANDAMVFAGTINTSGVVITPAKGMSFASGTSISAIPSPVTGWTFKVSSEAKAKSAVFDGIALEVGDMVIYTGSEWNVIQANINNPVEIASSLSDGALILGSGTNEIKSLANGSEGQVLRITNGAIAWGADTPNRAIQVNGNQVVAADSTLALDFVSGENVTITGDGSKLTFTSKDTKYTAGTGLRLNADNQFNLGIATATDLGGVKQGSTSGTTYGVNVDSNGAMTVDLQGLVTGSNGVTVSTSGRAFDVKLATTGTAGTSGANTSTTSATSIVIPKIVVDEYGRVTSHSDQTIGLKDYTVTAGTGIDVNNQSVSLKQATDSELGGIKLGYTETGQNYKVQLDNSGKAYVAVPWVNTTYTFTATPSVTDGLASITFGGIGNDQSIKLQGTGATSLSLKDGVIDINSSNTWRNVTAYKYVSGAVVSSDIGTAELKFGPGLIYNSDTIDIGWAEIDENGNITYK